jgi:non-ribosomal peptide synthetase component E (peptide arylation enzyme)
MQLAADDDRVVSAGPRLRLPGVVYQDPARLADYVAQGVLTAESLAGAFRSVARTHPDRIALSEPGWCCSYAELDALSDRCAMVLLRAGLARHDRVIFQLPNGRDLIIALLGCLKAELIPVCTLVAHRRHEIAVLARLSGARAHLVDGDDPKFDFQAFAREIRAEAPEVALTFVGGASGDLRDLIAAEDPLQAGLALSAITPDPFQVALFQLSGGTSGVPKIIPRFHNEYLYSLRSFITRHGFDAGIVAFTPNPMLHNAPMLCYYGAALFCGGEVVMSPTLDAETIGRLLQARRPNWLAIPLPVLLRLKQAGWLERLDFSQVRGCLVPSGAAHTRALLGGAPTFPLFGMTEGLLSCGCAADPVDLLDRTVGVPLSAHDEVRIIDPDTGADVPEGELGELIVRGPCTIRGYFAAEDRNREAFTPDGFYRSGDLMRFTRIGTRRCLVFGGRLKDVVSRGGEKINCQEVEQLAIGHPAIGAIAIVPMEDATYGERACAFVIPAPGSDGVTVRELGAHLESLGVAKFKWPERVELVDAFPMTSSGKLSKPLLRSWIAERQHQDALTTK